MIRVPDSIVRRVIATYGTTYESISKIPADKIGRDVLDEDKVHDQVAIFCRAFGLTPAELRGKRLLEIGSGFGIFLAVLRRDYGVESYGIEPSAGGFDTSREVAQEILASYGLDPLIVTNARGENLPYPDGHFDLIFSSNVLEHTEDPQLVLEEALRVLETGGLLQFVFPNYGAFFEGHYALPWIPYLGRTFGKLWLRLWGRDPAYIDTLQLTTYFRAKRWLHHRKDVVVIGYGEEIFRERMIGQQFKAWAGLGRVKRWVAIAHRLRVVKPLTWILLKLKSFDPIALALVKRPTGDGLSAPDNRRIYEVRWVDWTEMKVYGPSSRWLRTLIGDHLRRLERRGEHFRVIDVGCGEGTTTNFLAQQIESCEVLGIDRSEMGIECARSRYQRSNLSFLREERTATFPGHAFHLVTCFEVLEHAEDWRALTNELARLSSRYILVSFPTGRMRPFERNVGHLRNFRRGQFERFALEIGFEPISVYYAGFPFYSPIFRDLCNVINSGGSSFTIGHYSTIQRLTSSVTFAFFRYLSMNRHGDQFCGLFARRTGSDPIVQSV